MFNRVNKFNDRSNSYPRDNAESRSSLESLNTRSNDIKSNDTKSNDTKSNDAKSNDTRSDSSDSDIYERESNLNNEIKKLVPRNFYSLIVEALIEEKYEIVKFLVNKGITLPTDKNSFYPFMIGVKDIEKIYLKYMELHTEDKINKKQKDSIYPLLNIKYHLKTQITEPINLVKNLIDSNLKKDLKIRLLKDLIAELDERDDNLSNLFFNSYMSTKIGDYLLFSVKTGKKVSEFFDFLHDSLSVGLIFSLSLISDEDFYLKTKVLKKIFLTDLEIDLFIQMKNFNFEQISNFNKNESR